VPPVEPPPEVPDPVLPLVPEVPPAVPPAVPLEEPVLGALGVTVPPVPAVAPELLLLLELEPLIGEPHSLKP
jgi:hypothetical protein